MSSKQKEKRKKRGTLKRLVIANLIATLALLTATVAVLWALGLLSSIFAFFF